jgi:hypothetical protein
VKPTKPYDAGLGKKIRRCVGMRPEVWEKLEELCRKVNRKKSDVLERLVLAEHKKIFPK